MRRVSRHCCFLEEEEEPAMTVPILISFIIYIYIYIFFFFYYFIFLFFWRKTIFISKFINNYFNYIKSEN